jgi:hypothetical protein
LSYIGDVRVFSANYKGKVPNDGAQKRLCGNWFKSRTDAELSLKATAAFEGYNYVRDVELEGKEETENRYRYTMWRASGIAGTTLSPLSP